jgi:Na+/proline symporter
MYIAYSAVVIDSSYTELFQSDDTRQIQRILPDLILNRTPVWTQILFFGALLSAILSTASGAILAPSSLFTENVMQPFLKHLDDKTFLWVIRSVLVLFSVAASLMAINSSSTMYEMVQNAYKVTLVGAFIPLAMGIYWRRSSTQGALCSITLGIATWLVFEFTLPEGSEHPWAIVPPQLLGLLAAFLGMLLGSLTPQWIKTPEVDESKLRQRPERSIGH